MKLTMVILSLIPVMSWGSVSNFNDIINENSQVQREIQHTLKVSDDSTAAALGPNNDRRVVLESISYNAPTNAKAFKFKKEISEHRVSSKKEMSRVANEFKSMDRDL